MTKMVLGLVTCLICIFAGYEEGRHARPKDVRKFLRRGVSEQEDVTIYSPGGSTIMMRWKYPKDKMASARQDTL